MNVAPRVGFTQIWLAVLAASASSAFAADFDAAAIFPPIDTCIDAAVQQQDGQVVRWELNGAEVQVDVLAPDDRVWSMKCTNGKVSTPERKVGVKKSKLLKSRAKVPEKSARFTAVGSYPIAEVRRMEYDLTWKGRPYYTYEMVLNDGRQATVEVNAETGQVDRSKSERKD